MDPVRKSQCPANCVHQASTTTSNRSLTTRGLLRPSTVKILMPNESGRFCSSKTFGLVRLVFCVLERAKPTRLLLAACSVSVSDVTTVRQGIRANRLLSIQFLVSGQIHDVSPGPFSCLIAAFPSYCHYLTLRTGITLLCGRS